MKKGPGDRAFFSDVAVLSAVIATLFMPAAALLAALCVTLFNVSPHALVTFGDTFNEPLGLVAWWFVFLLPASAYAVTCVRNAD